MNNIIQKYLKKHSIICIFTSILMILTTQSMAFPSSESEWEQLRQSFDVPGFAMLPLEKCQPIGPITNVGSAVLEPLVPVNDNTIFEAASLSKPVFAYLVMTLIADGVIELDQIIAEEFAYQRIDDEKNYALLTPRMILSHQTGLPNWVGDTDKPNRNDAIDFESEAGTTFSYSGEAYELLRHYIEYKTKLSLEQLFRQELGELMPSSGFELNKLPSLEMSRGYRAASAPESGRAMTNLGGAAGGFTSTVSDYAAFLSQMCSDNGLPPAIKKIMLSPQVKANTGDFPAPTEWALGWGLMNFGPDIVVFHGGNNDEYRTFAGYSKVTGDGIVIMSNGRNGGDLINAILQLVQKSSGQ